METNPQSTSRGIMETKYGNHIMENYIAFCIMETTLQFYISVRVPVRVMTMGVRYVNPQKPYHYVKGVRVYGNYCTCLP